MAIVRLDSKVMTPVLVLLMAAMCRGTAWKTRETFSEQDDGATFQLSTTGIRIPQEHATRIGDQPILSDMAMGLGQDKTILDSSLMKRSAQQAVSNEYETKRESRRQSLRQRYRLFRKKKREHRGETTDPRNHHMASYLVKESNDLPGKRKIEIPSSPKRISSSPFFDSIDKHTQQSSGLGYEKFEKHTNPTNGLRYDKLTRENMSEKNETKTRTVKAWDGKSQTPKRSANDSNRLEKQPRHQENVKQYNKRWPERKTIKGNHKRRKQERVQKRRLNNKSERLKALKKLRKRKNFKNSRPSSGKVRHKYVFETATLFTLSSTLSIRKDVGYRPTFSPTYKTWYQRTRGHTVKSTKQMPISSTPRQKHLSETTTIHPFISPTRALDYLTTFEFMTKPKRWPVRLVLPAEDITKNSKEFRSQEIDSVSTVNPFEPVNKPVALKILNDNPDIENESQTNKRRKGKLRSRKRKWKNRKQRKRKRLRKRNKLRNNRTRSKSSVPMVARTVKVDPFHMTTKSEEQTTTNFINSMVTSVDPTTSTIRQNMERGFNDISDRNDNNDNNNNDIPSDKTTSVLDPFAISYPQTSSSTSPGPVKDFTSSTIKYLATTDSNRKTTLADTDGLPSDIITPYQRSSKSDNNLDLDKNDSFAELDIAGNMSFSDLFNSTELETWFMADLNFTESDILNSSVSNDSSSNHVALNDSLMSLNSTRPLEPNNISIVPAHSQHSTLQLDLSQVPVNKEMTSSTTSWSSEIAITSTIDQLTYSSGSFTTFQYSTQFPTTSVTQSTPTKTSASSSSELSRWMQWARRRKRKRKKKVSRTSRNKSKDSVRYTSHGSVAGSLVVSKTDDVRDQQTNKPTTERPFVGYKTAYDFLSKQKGVHRYGGNERRREDVELNQVMAENMCEVFDKHFVPTNIGGKCE